MLIQSNDELRQFCQALKASRFITLDTEFIRDRTYWPRLCLLQAAGESDIAAIDPLAEGIDLAPFFELLHAPEIMKVFHAARQDIEIFYHMTGFVPAPIADTQVMASVCGYGEAASYEALVNRVAGGTIDKSSRYTDWAQRPLSEKQLHYALDDVRYLRPVYEKLLQRVADEGRMHWITEDMAVLENPATYQLHPENAWKRLKMRVDKPRQFALLRDLAAWREEEAQKMDVPRGRVLKDEALGEICHHPPHSVEDLLRLRGLYPDVARGRIGAAVLEVVSKSLARPHEPLPDELKKKPATANTGAIADMLRVLLRFVAEKEGVAPRIIASSADLDALADKDDAPIPALHGWRFELFGKKALELKHGKLALKLHGTRVEFIEAPSP
ncbi:MAG TPA: ribonuclease D [Alphaproteobacteria bacterium]|nr:ribonuclease D [Alphaproteobacteria bacterium]